MAFMTCCLVACLAYPADALCQNKGGRAKAPVKSQAYHTDKEISFEMNSATGFVRIPAEYNWVKVYSLGEMATPVVGNKIEVKDRYYRFTIGIDELRKFCGTGVRKLPIKTKIFDVRGKKEKAFHITRLMVRFRVSGGADVQITGYIFDK